MGQIPTTELYACSWPGAATRQREGGKPQPRWLRPRPRNGARHSPTPPTPMPKAENFENKLLRSVTLHFYKVESAGAGARPRSRWAPAELPPARAGSRDLCCTRATASLLTNRVLTRGDDSQRQRSSGPLGDAEAGAAADKVPDFPSEQGQETSLRVFRGLAGVSGPVFQETVSLRTLCFEH